jgi:hypothetical protein
MSRAQSHYWRSRGARENDDHHATTDHNFLVAGGVAFGIARQHGPDGRLLAGQTGPLFLTAR